MSEYGYVVVLHTKDAAQGEMLAELLRNEGIAARFRGASSTLIGMADHIVSMSVEVPIDEETRAREYLRALEATAVAVESGGADVRSGTIQPPPAQGGQGRGWTRARIALVVSIVATLILLGFTLMLPALFP